MNKYIFIVIYMIEYLYSSMAEVLFIFLNCHKILAEIVMDIILYKYIHDDDKNTIFMT